MSNMEKDERQTEEFANPFLKEGGEEISTKEEWEEKRKQYCDFLERTLYGIRPAYTGTIESEVQNQEFLYEGKAVKETVRLWFFGKKNPGMDVRILRPSRKGKVPVIVWNCSRKMEHCPVEELLVCERKFALAVFNREDLAWDNETSGILEEQYPDADWGRIAQWGWGMSRIMDYLDTTEYAMPDHYIVTGHSRGGKVSLYEGIYEKRVAMCHSNGSGCGGAGSMEFLGSRYGRGIGRCETLENVSQDMPYWWGKQVDTFVEQWNTFPLDSHILRALVAPRVLLTTEACGDTWSNPYGTLAAWRAAQEVFDFLECPENNGIQFRDGGHDFLKEDWEALMDFYDMHFRGGSCQDTLMYFQSGWKEGEDPFDWRNIKLHYDWSRPDPKLDRVPEK